MVFPYRNLHMFSLCLGSAKQILGKQTVPATPAGLDIKTLSFCAIVQKHVRSIQNTFG